MPQLAFRAAPAATVNIDVSASSQAIQVSTSAAPQQVRVMNNGTATVWIKFGASNVAATLAADHPVGPGATEIFTVAEGVAPYVAAIAAGATGKIYFTPGAGI